MKRDRFVNGRPSRLAGRGASSHDTPGMTFDCHAILFDLDGVLVDSNAIAERHWRLWAERVGVPWGAIADSHHGVPTVQTIRRLAPHLDAEAEAAAKEKPEADDTEGLVAYAAAGPLLASISDGRWAIVTSGTRRTALTRLRHVGLPVPDVLVTADDVTRGKPDPQPYARAAAAHGFDPAECVVFEDAPAGVTAGKAAGARVVGLATSCAADRLAGADAVVESLDDARLLVDDGGLRIDLTATSSGGGR